MILASQIGNQSCNQPPIPTHIVLHYFSIFITKCGYLLYSQSTRSTKCLLWLYIMSLIVGCTVSVLCIRYDFSWRPPTDGVHNSWKVKIHHVSPNNCGCGWMQMLIIWRPCVYVMCMYVVVCIYMQAKVNNASNNT